MQQKDEKVKKQTMDVSLFENKKSKENKQYVETRSFEKLDGI